MILKRKFIYVIFFIVLLPFKSIASDVHLPSAGFDCSDTNNKFEFLFDRSKDMDNPKVYRRIKGKFLLIKKLGKSYNNYVKKLTRK